MSDTLNESPDKIGARMPQASDILSQGPMLLEQMNAGFEAIFNEIQILKIDIEQTNDNLDRLYKEISKNSEND